MIRRALLSVSDKTGLVPFAKRLAAAGVETRGLLKLRAIAEDEPRSGQPGLDRPDGDF